MCKNVHCVPSIVLNNTIGIKKVWKIFCKMYLLHSNFGDRKIVSSKDGRNYISHSMYSFGNVILPLSHQVMEFVSLFLESEQALYLLWVIVCGKRDVVHNWGSMSI